MTTKTKTKARAKAKNKTEAKAKAKAKKAKTKESAGSHARANSASEEADREAVIEVAVRSAVPETGGENKLPPAGTEITKFFLRGPNRGKPRCRCTVEEDGIRYKTRLYTSLSAAAMAAAKDLGLTNKTQNGYVFWNLTKPRRPAADHKEASSRAFERYVSRITPLVSRNQDPESRAATATMLREQIATLEDLHGRVA